MTAPYKQPLHIGFMDADMLDLFHQMQPEDLPGYILYGGTALAMYLNHRRSTDFDFFKPDSISLEKIQNIPWLQGAKFTGKYGMIDAEIKKNHRTVKFNFVCIDSFNTERPKHPNRKAPPNNLIIAHPVDILTGKIGAMSTRQAYRDFYDIGAAYRQIPDDLNKAIIEHLKSPLTKEENPPDLAKSTICYPYEFEYGSPEPIVNAVNTLAEKLKKYATLGEFINHAEELE
ncbi:MAG: nucleotidyl transferase AbiEii/AbiGii toxin family protein [Gammaproteobacteria bacterium]|nr:nucleotidyl transferase AbiEii/AbiGii toxin family protein [Gammaproteobacteria bacterium]MCY4339584.1 nucleotidyl transferase AbiEii/AbiGii toxin family protein [Gammaproteobacteria bacterium]